MESRSGDLTGGPYNGAYTYTFSMSRDTKIARIASNKALPNVDFALGQCSNQYEKSYPTPSGSIARTKIG
jgi:hypothetical protein